MTQRESKYVKRNNKSIFTGISTLNNRTYNLRIYGTVECLLKNGRGGRHTNLEELDFGPVLRMGDREKEIRCDRLRPIL